VAVKPHQVRAYRFASRPSSRLRSPAPLFGPV
jgi:hypothetical protein